MGLGVHRATPGSWGLIQGLLEIATTFREDWTGGTKLRTSKVPPGKGCLGRQLAQVL